MLEQHSTFTHLKNILNSPEMEREEREGRAEIEEREERAERTESTERRGEGVEGEEEGGEVRQLAEEEMTLSSKLRFVDLSM